MALALLIVGGIGFVFLLVTATLLCVLNYSEKLWGPIVSIALGGVVAAIIAVASGLKESRIEEGFATSVVFQQGLPALLIFDPQAEKLSARLSDLASLGRPSVQQGSQTVLTVQPATTDTDLFRFGGELLQYQVIQKLGSIQRGGWEISATGVSARSAVRIPVQVSKIKDIPGVEVLRKLQRNRFANSDLQRMLWEHGRLPLPEGTTIKLGHQPSSPETGPERHIVRLEKPWFFVIEIMIEPMGGSGPGTIPAGLHVDENVRSDLRTFHFKVVCRAKFEMLTAGNWQTDEHKKWAEWLFAEIRQRIGD
jgi:hypothetical protein